MCLWNISDTAPNATIKTGASHFLQLPQLSYFFPKKLVLLYFLRLCVFFSRISWNGDVDDLSLHCLLTNEDNVRPSSFSDSCNLWLWYLVYWPLFPNQYEFPYFDKTVACSFSTTVSCLCSYHLSVVLVIALAHLPMGNDATLRCLWMYFDKLWADRCDVVDRLIKFATHPTYLWNGAIFNVVAIVQPSSAPQSPLLSHCSLATG